MPFDTSRMALTLRPWTGPRAGARPRENRKSTERVQGEHRESTERAQGEHRESIVTAQGELKESTGRAQGDPEEGEILEKNKIA